MPQPNSAHYGGSPACDQPSLKQALGTEVSFIADEELDLTKSFHSI